MNELTFHGPYTLASVDTDVLGDCPYKDEPGIYLWCVPTDKFGFVVDYVGETNQSFYKRTKEHMIRTIGGDYEICDPKALTRAEYSIIWRGLWRKGTRDKLPEFLSRVHELAPLIREFIQLHRLFLAPTDLDDRKRKRLEGAIATTIRSSTPCLLSPDVRYIQRNKSERPIKYGLRSARPIYSLPVEVAA